MVTQWSWRHRGLRAMGMSGVVALAAFIYFLRVEREIVSRGTPIALVIAATDLPAQIALTPAMLALREIPRQFVPPGALQDPEEAIGMVTVTTMRAGEILTVTRVAPVTDPPILSATIGGGRRAIAIPVDDAHAAGGLIRPGDRVDLLARFDVGMTGMTQRHLVTLLQGLRVLAVGSAMADLYEERLPSKPPAQRHGLSGTPAQRAATITVEVSREEAQSALFALANGEVFLSLLPGLEVQRAPPIAPATAASVTGLTSLVPRREYRGR
ncbi:MAG: Flp pilus assembly protein CpaB [Deltaproteobacteria bacterium]|nr:Flp pilus assembly protein CpaB [Deltaproteobacteria bacterium]